MAFRMRIRSNCLFKIGLMFVALIFYCEYFVYYVTLWQCNYPNVAQEDPLRAMLLADTHLLGSRLGFWWDKLRREWQMHRAFVTAYQYFRPDVVFFLGDLLDEGKWCGKAEFLEYRKRFFSLFPTYPTDTETVFLAGNHDIGFHYATHPYLTSRFEGAFRSPQGVKLFSIAGIHFVLVNSIAMTGDKCSLCSKALEELDTVTKELDCLGVAEIADCPQAGHGQVYSRPILLQHFPLHRTSDVDCGDDEDVAENKGDPFRPEFDSLSINSTLLLLQKVKPRLAISGHTHNGCRTKRRFMVEFRTSDGEQREDQLEVDEWSVASFSWRNRNNPNFLLASFTPDEYSISKCYLPREWTVIGVYVFGAMIIVLYSLFSSRLMRFIRSVIQYVNYQ